MMTDRQKQPIRPSTLILLSIFLASFFTVLSAQKVSATVDVRSFTINEVVTFTISAEDASDNPTADISPLLKDFSIVSGPSTQTNMQFVNGRMTSSRNISWTLIANRDGEITIPTLAVKLGRKTFHTKPIDLKVKKSDVTGDPDDLFVVAEVDKRSVVVGEQITVVYKLYTRVNMTIKELQSPEYVGFWTEELYSPRQIDFRDTQIKGERYKVATLYKVALFPTKTGEIVLPPMVLNCNVEIRQKNRRRSVWDDPFFNSLDPFFGNRSTKPRIIRTDEEIIKVRSFDGLPPIGYTNAVGQFKLNSNVDDKDVKANEAITFQVVLHGTGNLPILKLPDIEFPADLEVFPPTSDTQRDPFRDEITGTITLEYILIPRKPGTYILPRIKFSYYNPKLRAWESSETQAIRLTVNPGEQPVNAGPGFTKEEIVLLGKDIRYIKPDVPRWNTNAAMNFQWIFLVYYGAAFGLFLIPGRILTYRKRWAGTEIQRTSKKALRSAEKKLVQKQEDVFGQSAAVIYSYLQEKFQLDSDNLDPLSVRNHFDTILRGETLIKLEELLRICDAGRFSPGAIGREENILRETKTIVREIDGQV